MLDQHLFNAGVIHLKANLQQLRIIISIELQVHQNLTGKPSFKSKLHTNKA